MAKPQFTAVEITVFDRQEESLKFDQEIHVLRKKPCSV